MGNIILLNVAIDALKTRFPELVIDLLLPGAYRELMADDPRIRRVTPVYKKEYITRPWKLISLISSLREQKYDMAIDCSDVNSHSLTGVIYTLLAGPGITAGWKISEKSIFDIEVPRYSETTHATEMYLRLIEGIFSVKMSGSPYFPEIPPDTGESNNIVGINCGGRGSKRWPLENFIELGEKLSASGFTAEFILGPDEEDSRVLLGKRLPDSATLLPLMSLPKLRERILSYSVFVSSDTGPMHLAWCLGIPTLAIFLDSEMEKFKPLSPGSSAINGGDGISPQVVYDRVVGMINSKRIPA